ncbi:hypothetical protein R1flu_022188 [Riccia fluitans]|uniref:Uncharacterized protein n=1 Tax=Riccia fluitans TaxID=41844 RepID=A0ABD1ZRH1_9MARC
MSRLRTRDVITSASFSILVLELLLVTTCLYPGLRAQALSGAYSNSYSAATRISRENVDPDLEILIPERHAFGRSVQQVSPDPALTSEELERLHNLLDDGNTLAETDSTMRRVTPFSVWLPQRYSNDSFEYDPLQ